MVEYGTEGRCYIVDCGIMDTEESNFRVTGFPVSDRIGNTGDSLVKNMVVCLFHDIESGGNKCITDFHRGSESGIRRNVCTFQKM